MRWLMLCREPRLYSCKRLKAACELQGIELDILDPNRFLICLGELPQLYYQHGESYDLQRQPPQPLPDYQAVLPRFGVASTEMGCHLLHYFESQGVSVLNNAAAFALARDKWRSLQALRAAGIAVPPSRFSGHLVAATGHFHQQAYPVVLKTISGSQGVGVMLAEQSSSAMSVMESLRQANVPLLSQDFIREAAGQDIRAFVVGDRVVAAMQRQGASGEFRANLHLGGNAIPISLSETEKQLALAATRAIGLDVAGVDLIRSTEGQLVLEVNAAPGLEGIEQATGQDVAAAMVNYLMVKLNVKREQEKTACQSY